MSECRSFSVSLTRPYLKRHQGRVLESLDITPLLKFALTSEEEGVEKPDKRIFQIACERAECRPGQVLHVGDELRWFVAIVLVRANLSSNCGSSDYEGATQAGMRALLLRRNPPDEGAPIEESEKIGTDVRTSSSLNEALRFVLDHR